MSNVSPFESKVLQAQLLLQETSLDGWLLYSYRNHNDYLTRLLAPHFILRAEFPVFFWIPSHGSSVVCLHEKDHACTRLPIEVKTYLSWKERTSLLSTLLEQTVRIASEFSFKAYIPECSFLDAGTYTLIKSFGIDLVSSEDLFSELLLTWTQEELNQHLFAASILELFCCYLPKKIREILCSGNVLSELYLKNYILSVLECSGCVTEIPPKVLVNERSSLPDAVSLEEAKITWGDYLLVDLACRKKKEGAPYATLSRCFFLGDSPGSFLCDSFFIAKRAQKAALDFIEERGNDAHSCLGWEVDRVARNFIGLAGLESSFCCPLGHSIDSNSLVGLGPRLDDLHFHETRKILPKTCFCLGPSLYIDNFLGIDIKTSVYVASSGKLFLTTGEQTTLYTFTEGRESHIPIQSAKTISF